MMIKHIFVGLALLPLLAFAQVSNLGIGRDVSGNVRIIDGNYECSYGSITEDETLKGNFKSANIYVENMENETILFIASFPGNISVNPPLTGKIDQTKELVTYRYTDKKDKSFVIGASSSKGVYAMIAVKNDLLGASTLIYNCKMIKNLEHPTPAD
jgi:hypothetical protein